MDKRSLMRTESVSSLTGLFALQEKNPAHSLQFYMSRAKIRVVIQFKTIATTRKVNSKVMKSKLRFRHFTSLYKIPTSR